MTVQNRRTHHFPANDLIIITGLTAKGEYVAFRQDEELPRGYGPTVLSSIADLNEKIAREGSIFERDEDYLTAEAAE